MRNRTLLAILSAIGFVGFSSCGNESPQQDPNMAAENALLHAELAKRSQQQPGAVNVVTTVVATSVVNVTYTQGGTSGGGVTTVVYTVTAAGTSTGTAPRE